MNSTLAASTADMKQAQSIKPPCPLWKKIVAGVLVVAAVALALSATGWLAPLDSSSVEMLKGLSVIIGSSIGLVLAGIALVTGILWLVGRSAKIMGRGREGVAYVVHCYPQQIKDRILSH
ncbi:MAG: hypothetical protein LJE70_09160 [Chromatiaceae bacterium]|nr:hypothetical protein [Chromatiaceae bacterium]